MDHKYAIYVNEAASGLGSVFEVSKYINFMW